MSVLRIARLAENSAVLGPGRRAVVWVHGCSRDCPGCVGRSMNRSAASEEWTAEALARWTLALPGIEGVTVSGGEPYEQDPAALAEYLEALRRASELSVMLYTGRLIGEWRSSPGHRRVLDSVDLAVDGEYIEAADHGEKWRGSANQRFHCLTSRYAATAAEWTAARGREWELDLAPDGGLYLNGLPEAGFAEELQRRLEGRGIAVRGWR